MGRKKGIFAIENVEVQSNVAIPLSKRNSLTIEQALTTVFQQMKVSGNRERTISDYKYIFNQYVITNNLYVRYYTDTIQLDSCI
jgi:hypothetical protein